MIDSDDIPMIFVDLLEVGSGKLEVWFLEVNRDFPRSTKVKQEHDELSNLDSN